MLFRKPGVGREINAYCGKCKLERTHIIAAMDGENVRKVTCTMCNSTHNFRGNSPPGDQEVAAIIDLARCRRVATKAVEYVRHTCRATDKIV